jgi:hypothetical protein
MVIRAETHLRYSLQGQLIAPKYFAVLTASVPAS